jgi:uncharacterized protein (DUF608 family)
MGLEPWAVDTVGDSIAVAAMADMVEDKDTAQYLLSKFSQAEQVCDKQLWNGSYFSYNCSTNGNNNSIQVSAMSSVGL